MVTPRVPNSVGGASTVIDSSTVAVTPLAPVATNWITPDPGGRLTMPLTIGIDTAAPLYSTTVPLTDAVAPSHAPCAVGLVTARGLLPLLQLSIVTESGTGPNTGALRSLIVTGSVTRFSMPLVSVPMIVIWCVVPTGSVVVALAPSPTD